MERSSDELLSKCLHGKTQNQNEIFNATIWERLPKTKYNSFTHLELETYDAVACCNIGRKAMRPGLYTVDGCAKLNKKRLSRSAYRNKTVVKKRRTVVRGKTKKGEDSQLDKEGTVYTPGSFKVHPSNTVIDNLAAVIYLKTAIFIATHLRNIILCTCYYIY